MFDHVDVRVRRLAAVRPLMDALLPELGYVRINADAESAGYHRDGETGSEPFIWFVENAAHVSNGTRLAFQAESRDQVDRLSEVARSHGARSFEAPAIIAGYSPSYYASFFEDAEGNKYEICCRKRV